MPTVKAKWTHALYQSWCDTHQDFLARLAFLLVCGMPLWLVLGRAVADIGVTTVSVCFLLHSLIKRDWSWIHNVESRLLGALYIYMVIQSNIAAPDTSALAYAAAYARVLLFYLALRFWIFTKRTSVIASFGFMLPVVALVLFDTYFQYFTGASLRGHAVSLDTARLTGPLSHYNIGNYMFKIAIPIIAMALLFGRNIHSRAFYPMVATFLFLIIMVIPLSGERSVTVALLVGLSSALVLAFLKLKQQRHCVWLSMFALVVIGAVLSSQSVVVDRGEQLVDNVTHFNSSVYGQLFKASSILITEHPWLGIGVQQFSIASKALFDSGTITYWDVHPHNFYIQWWVETGVFGLMIMVAFLGFLIIRAFRVFWPISDTRILSLSLVLGNLLGFLFPLGIAQSNFSNWSECIYWFSLALMITIIEQHGVSDG